MVPVSRRSALSTVSGVLVLLSGVRPAPADGDDVTHITIRSAGSRTLSAVLSLPRQLPAPAVLSIHGSLGLTSWYKSQAAELAKAGFVGLAVDLFPGQVARDLDGEQRLIAAASCDAMGTTETLADWVQWLRRDPRTNGKVGILGWSFGAWWALHASIAAASDATVIYYGLRYGAPAANETEVLELARLKGPLLAHFGAFDSSIPEEQVGRFRRELNAAKRTFEIDWYPANHGFADPTVDAYDRRAAALAWSRTVEFLRATLTSPPDAG
jgi:carboxymethylenebutenolidase